MNISIASNKLIANMKMWIKWQFSRNMKHERLLEVMGDKQKVLGTWVSQVKGLGCEGEGYEVRLVWEQWRQQGSNHELYASTQHTEKS